MAGAAVGLALGSALLWGTADYFGGMSARRAPALAVTLWGQVAGLLVAWALVAITGAWLTGASAGWAVAAGVCGAFSLVLFYAALAAGAMTIVAPLGACGAVIPVTVALIGGESPGELGAAGMGLAVIGAVLASIGADEDHPTRLTRRALALAIGAGVGLGATVALLQATDDARSDPIAVVAVMRLVGVPALVAVLALSRTAPALPRGIWPLVAMVGLFDAAANLTFVAATAEGEHGVVAVLGSMYPLATVVLATVLLRERPHRLQVLGVAVALVGVALIALR